MGTKHSGARPAEAEPTWTDEALPMDLRRELLDKALDKIKSERAEASHPGNEDDPVHPGVSGSESSGHSE